MPRRIAHSASAPECLAQERIGPDHAAEADEAEQQRERVGGDPDEVRPACRAPLQCARTRSFDPLDFGRWAVAIGEDEEQHGEELESADGGEQADQAGRRGGGGERTRLVARACEAR
eukprot:1152845-Rhodomonas_salina.1